MNPEGNAAPASFTVVGASGFVGRHLVAHLAAGGHEVTPLDRLPATLPRELDHVIDCGGLTADFRTRRGDLFEAHVSRIDRLLGTVECRSYLYLSSTRVYKNSAATHEDAVLEVQPAVFDDSYNISKIAGEATCLIRPQQTVRVARLSNVLGPNPDPAVFLTSLMREARATGRVTLRESILSAKDYIAVSDVCRYLEAVALRGVKRLYNVAYGENRTHRQILDHLATLMPLTFEAPEEPVRAFPPIDTARLVSEFGPPAITPEHGIAQAFHAWGA